jgi:hypothetical protein
MSGSPIVDPYGLNPMAREICSLKPSPCGVTDVDAGPNNALNLALVCDARIRIDVALLDDADAASPVDRRQFPTRESELVVEWAEARREMLAMLHKRDK